MVEGGPKLVRIDIRTDKVVQTIAFDSRLAPQGQSGAASKGVAGAIRIIEQSILLNIDK